jgi:hypothetical protein
MKHRRLTPVLAALSLLFSGVGFAATEAFEFDPDGGGPGASIIVQSFDWLPGSALSVGSVPVPVTPAVAPSTTLAHASLGNFLNASNLAILGTGLNSAYEMTMTLSIPQIGTSSGNGAFFTFDSTGSPNFFEVYWDPSRDANVLAGTGYNNGSLILSGIVTSASSNFLLTNSTPTNLDNYLGDNYPAIDTVSGVGGGQISVQVLFADPAFFPSQLPETLLFNTSQITPYNQVDPSAMFTASAGGGAPATAPAIGPINGLSGPDFQMQADSNMAITLQPIVTGACRMTGGGVTADGEILLDTTGSPVPTAQAADGKNIYTFGGQIGAPTAAAPNPMGEWTHHQFKGPAGDFVFRVGTSSAPKDTFVTQVTCSDPVNCQPARPAPFKQLDWQGIGSFRNGKGALASSVNTENDKTPGYSRHFVRVHIEDLGEPGGSGQQHSTGCTHVIGTLIGDPTTNSAAAAVCSSCADAYQIEIHATEDSGSPVIYAVGGYIDQGNLQIHPEIK